MTRTNDMRPAFPNPKTGMPTYKDRGPVGKSTLVSSKQYGACVCPRCGRDMSPGEHMMRDESQSKAESPWVCCRCMAVVRGLSVPGLNAPLPKPEAGQ